jgi:hypothetical protein
MDNYDPRRRNDEERRQARAEDRGRDRDSWWRDRSHHDDHPRRAERGWLDYDPDYGRSGERQGGRDEQRYGRDEQRYGGGAERSRNFSPDWSREGEQPLRSDEPYYARNREREGYDEGASRNRSASRQRSDDYYDPDWPYPRRGQDNDVQRAGGDEQQGSHYRGYYSRSGGPISYPGGRGYLYAESLMLHGPYTGRGPKGYKRSDQQIMEEACQRLERDGEIDASEIEVSVEDGVIRLGGTVQDRRTKRHAEECVESIYGARDVMNELRVSQQGGEQSRGMQGEEQSRGMHGSLGSQSGQPSQGSQAAGSHASGSQSSTGMRQGAGSTGSEQPGDDKRSPRH